MQLKIYAASKCEDNGKPSQRSGGAVIGIADAKRGSYSHKFSQPYGSTTANLAEVHTARLALLSVAEKFRTHKIELVTDGYFVNRMLGRNGSEYNAKPNTNKKQIEQLRSLIERFADLTITYQKSGDTTLDQCQAMAQVAMRSQRRVPGFTDELSKDSNRSPA